MGMNMLNRTELEGHEVYTSDGEKLGKVDEIFYDRKTDNPEWIKVKGGFLGMKKTLAPITGAVAKGEDIYLPCSKEQLENAPDVDESRFTSDDDERKVYSHYGVEYPGRSFGQAGDGDSYVPGDWSSTSEQNESQQTRLRRWTNI